MRSREAWVLAMAMWGIVVAAIGQEQKQAGERKQGDVIKAELGADAQVGAGGFGGRLYSAGAGRGISRWALAHGWMWLPIRLVTEPQASAWRLIGSVAALAAGR
jgi:hypothetical protein